MAQLITGTAPLSYQGVQASTPPNFMRMNRVPTVNDTNFVIGTIWMVPNIAVPVNSQVFILVGLSLPAATAVATWIPIYPANVPANLSFTTTIGGPIAPTVAGVVSIDSGVNTTSVGLGGSHFKFDLNDNIALAGTLTLSSLGAGVMTTSPGGVVTSTNLGSGVVQSSAAGVLSATNGSPGGTNGQVLISGGTGPIWNFMTSTGGTIAISSPGANQINLESVGVGSGAITFHNDNAVDAIALGAAITMAGGSNITTAGSNPGPTGRVTINLVNSPSVSGTITAGTGLVATTGGITLSNFIEGALVSSSTGVVTSVTGTAGYVLTANAPGTAPSFQATAGGAVSSVTGTANQVTAAPTTGAVVLTTPAVFIAPGSILATTTVAATTTVTAGTDLISTAGNLNLPTTNAGGTSGYININALPFAHNFGTHNTFIGQQAGNASGMNVGSSTDNNALGFTTLGSLTTGQSNSAFGDVAGVSITTGSFNMAYGTQSLQHLLTGSYNIGIGYQSGNAYTGAESSNLLLSSPGLIGESNVIRIGTSGNGNGQQQDTFIAGLFAPNTPLNANRQPLFVDGNGKTGIIPPGINGQILIASTGGVPQWANLTSTGGVSITNGANSIGLGSAGGAGGTTLFHTQSGDATENVADTSVTLVGSGVVTTSGLNHTVTTALTNSLVPGANQASLLLGTAATQVPAWGLITSTDGSVTITQPTATSINLATVGGGGGVTTFTEDSGSATPSAGTIQIKGGTSVGGVATNINTIGAGNLVSVCLNNNITLPATNAAGTHGNIFIGAGVTALALPGVGNTYVGGNYVLAITGHENTCVGQDAGHRITSGPQNVCVGWEAGNSITTSGGNVLVGPVAGDNIITGSGENVAIGDSALTGITTGSYNVAIGYQAGSSYTTSNSSNVVISNVGNGSGAESHTIRIGTQGTGNGQQNNTYIAGIYGATLGATTRLVFSDSTGKIATGAAFGSGVLVSNSSGTVTSSAGNNGQVLIGATGGAPAWANITSPNATLVITNGPNSIGIDIGASVAFLYIQNSSTGNNVTGDNTLYTLGSTVPLTQIFDKGTNFTGTTFTAPVTGKYQLNMQVLATNLNYTPPPPTRNTCPLNIVTTARTYSLINTQFSSTLATQSVEYAVFVNMTAGDTAIFQFGMLSNSGTKTIGVGASQTFISGFFVTT
jgi:hypothetical protein